MDASYSNALTSTAPHLLTDSCDARKPFFYSSVHLTHAATTHVTPRCLLRKFARLPPPLHNSLTDRLSNSLANNSLLLLLLLLCS